MTAQHGKAAQSRRSMAKQRNDGALLTGRHAIHHTMLQRSATARAAWQHRASLQHGAADCNAALQIREERLWSGHPDVAKTLNNIANVCVATQLVAYQLRAAVATPPSTMIALQRVWGML
jgi:hypothetical protein